MLGATARGSPVDRQSRRVKDVQRPDYAHLLYNSPFDLGHQYMLPVQDIAHAELRWLWNSAGGLQVWVRPHGHCSASALGLQSLFLALTGTVPRSRL